MIVYTTTSGLLSLRYSGYVDISDTMGMGMMSHYIFIESEKEPATDPVILWSNGGPGASSLFGLLAELGPLQVRHNWIVRFGHGR